MFALRTATAVLLLLAAASPANAQVIRGKLLDNETAAPIARGQVSLMQAGRLVMREAITDDDGRFLFRLRSPGAYQLRGQSLGYREALTADVHLLPSDTIDVELRLATSAVVLSPLTVTAATRMPIAAQRIAEFHARRRRGFGTFLGPEEIARMVPFHASEVLRNLPGLVVQTGRGSNRVLMRAIATEFCTPTLYLDGSLIRDAEVDEVVSGSAVRAVEIYRRASQVPATFMSPRNMGCGAIVIWTTLTMPDPRR